LGFQAGIIIVVSGVGFARDIGPRAGTVRIDVVLLVDVIKPPLDTPQLAVGRKAAPSVNWVGRLPYP
jgi:hypothetical protein